MLEYVNDNKARIDKMCSKRVPKIGGGFIELQFPYFTYPKVFVYENEVSQNLFTYIPIKTNLNNLVFKLVTNDYVNSKFYIEGTVKLTEEVKKEIEKDKALSKQRLENDAFNLLLLHPVIHESDIKTQPDRKTDIFVKINV